jgi:KDO2-lipid IV(A) lauroyltransferase
VSPTRSAVTDYAVYLVLRFFICVVQALPPSVAGRLAAGLAWLAYRLDHRHRLVARTNLLQAFPAHWAEEELDRVVWSTYRHFCAMLVEIAQLPRKLHAHTLRRYMRCADPAQREQFYHWLRSPRPLLLVSGHFGNWEMASYNLGLTGFPSYAVARPLDNPFIDEFLRRFRKKTGQRLLAKNGDLERIEDILAGGGRVAVLADQDAGPRGLFVSFFGQPASTHKAIALLALEHSAPVLVIGARKVGEPMRYHIVIEDVILPEDYAGRRDAVPAITQRFTTALERLIRSAPEQYFWLHRRWKSQPPKARRLAA